jgi:nucleotide-binding universal stress UspA family protein
MAILDRIVVPVAGEQDAIETSRALQPFVDRISELTVVHVIEKGGGTVDKAPMAKRRADAAEFLSTVESHLDGAVGFEPRIEFGPNIAETIRGVAIDTNATAIALRPRGGSRLVRWLSGDTARRLLAESAIPVVSLPTHAGAAGPTNAGSPAIEREVSG